MKRRFFISILLLISICLNAQLPKLTFSPHWLPQAQFAGYYIAKEKGFYQQEGIDVNIVHPSASGTITEKLVTRESDIVSLFLVTAIASKANGINLVNIGQTSQNSALVIVSKKENGIDSLAQFEGKKIGIWKSGFDEVPKALFIDKKINVTWVPILSTINLFMIDGIDAMTVMYYNEYDQIINAGIDGDELNVFPLANYGYNIPEDGIYCLKETAELRKDDLAKFVKATLKGWEYAKAHKDETLNIVINIMKEHHIPNNRAHQAWMLQKVIDHMEPGDKKVKKGILFEPDFNKTIEILHKTGKIEDDLEFSDFNFSVID